MPKFYEWRSSPASFFLRALEYAAFVAKTKRADTAEIIHGQQIIKCVERMRLSYFSFTAQFLSSFGVIAQNDTPCPSIRLCVGNRSMEERTVFRLAMELWSRLERKRWPQRETRRVAESTCAVFESSVFTTPLQVVTQRADLRPLA